jgi:hypothetical protein
LTFDRLFTSLSQEGKIYFIKSEVNCNTAVVANPSFVFFNGTDGISRINASMTFLKELERVVIEIEAFAKPLDGNQFHNVFKLNTNLCKINNVLRGNFVGKMISEALKNYSNWFFDCPQKKGFYYAYNVELSDKFLPLYFIAKDAYWYVKILTRGNFKDKKGTGNILSVVAHGSFVKS